jgi:dTDP-4-dehydrorhamnose reductase
LLRKHLFNINKNISNENIYTWYTFATEIFKEVELNKNNFEDFNKPFLLVKDTFKNTFKEIIKEKYEEKILEKISNLDNSSKLFLYR